MNSTIELENPFESITENAYNIRYTYKQGKTWEQGNEYLKALWGDTKHARWKNTGTGIVFWIEDCNKYCGCEEEEKPIKKRYFKQVFDDNIDEYIDCIEDKPLVYMFFKSQTRGVKELKPIEMEELFKLCREFIERVNRGCPK